MDRALAAIRRLEAHLGNPRRARDASPWLTEGSKAFAGLAPDEADWVRGHAYAAMAKAPDASAVQFLEQAREDLRTSLSPIVLAGVARYLRMTRAGADWSADLQAAAERIRYSDRYPDFVFDPPTTCCHPALTCREEIERTLADASGRAEPDGQSGVATGSAAEDCGPLPEDLLSVRFQDQDGLDLTFAEILSCGPVLLAPFYTRCMNPAKCSLTIARLAKAAHALPHIMLLGLTYDPAFDTAHRLHGYGKDRGFAYGPKARMVRCNSGWARLRTALRLRAGYGGATVNSHARELILLLPGRAFWRLPADWLADPDRIAAFVAEPAERAGVASPFNA